MSITDELRAVAAKTECANGRCEKLYRGDLDHIADRIDAEHKKACDDAWDNGYEADYLGIEKWLTEHPQVMGHHGWVQLPKDADGEPIHVGDVMKWCDSGDTLEVIGIGDDTLFYVDPEGDRTYAEWTSARNKRHYHAPTVEDVLWESLKHFGAVEERTSEVDEWLHEQAAKLRLAEGEDA